MKAKATIFAGICVSLAIGGAFAWSEWTGMEASDLKPPVRLISDNSAPAASDGAVEGGKKVLPAGNFFGDAANGYAAAAKCPEILAKLFCYCGCDVTDSHTSLLDCFTSNHGADCPICTEEAIIAADMKRLKRTVPQIQLAIDSKFAKEYPFTEQSPALKKYRTTAVRAKASADAPSTSVATTFFTPKLKPGKQAGSCCK